MYKINNREALSIRIPTTADIIEMLERAGFNIANLINPDLMPVLEAEVNHEIDLMHRRSDASSVFQARVRRWIQHRNWKY
ncbi:hypothetical protein GF359_08185 [candidate division WOR-3 bacterium]|uniref:Uncharacterized protein n=1 Tax=candidate division WOR-3 bacterium TaxID=2052148 RepID=A0A9D5KBL1_UNCW3|nr:hypothetical protein [candidate division WOR-3 bacterium]MBD3365179.1 hypothetical protein [candidate division WOR-3 bacterium]